MRRIAQAAQENFGGFDTWVNDAGVSIYGKLLEISVEDMRRVFETNFWGLVCGSLEAARTLKERGGAMINIGSTLSDRAIPMQGIYSASKHAVKGFTDALRMELESEGAPISISLVCPALSRRPIRSMLKITCRSSPKIRRRCMPLRPLLAPSCTARKLLNATCSLAPAVKASRYWAVSLRVWRTNHGKNHHQATAE